MYSQQDHLKNISFIDILLFEVNDMKIVRTDRYDVAVFGGGTAGFAAAVAAARKGKNVCLVEKNTFLGGVATACGINQLLAGRKLRTRACYRRYF